MVGRGRQKTELKLVEKKESQLVCFTKRRSDLFKKARELTILSGAKIGAIAFSPAGKLYTLDALSLDSFLGSQMEKDSNSSKGIEFVDGMMGEETPFWFDKPQVQTMGYDELLQFERAMLEYGEKKWGNCEF